MQFKATLITLGGLFLLLAGLRPDALPFIPEARFSDAATSHWPAAYRLREAVLQEGTFPYWQDTILAGSPFAANPLNKTAYPLQWLALLLPPAPFLNVMTVLHLFLAGWGMYRWMRALDLPEYAALLSAVAYAFAPKLLAHLGAGHVDVLYALAWWPFLMASVYILSREGLSDTPVKRVLEVAIVAALLFLADVRLSLFAFALAGAYAVVQSQRLVNLRPFLMVVPLLVLLTSWLVLPLLLWQPYLSRSDMTAADAGLFSIEAGQFVGLLLPTHGGNPETILYLGLPVLLLALIAVFAQPRQHLFWMVAIIVGILYAMGLNSPFWTTLVNIFPILLWFRVPARAWFVVMLAMSVLAGYGLRVVMNTLERLRQDNTLTRLVIKRLSLAGLIGASLFCGGFTLGVLTDLEPTIGLGVMVVGALLGLILLLALYQKLTPQQVAVLLILLTLGDLGWTGRAWLEWRTPDNWLTHQDTLANYLQSELEKQAILTARIYSPNYALEQQVAVAHDLHLFYGVDPFQLRDVVEAIGQASSISNAGYSVIQPPLPEVEDDEDLLQANCDVQPNLDVLAEWDVYWIVSTCPLELESDTHPVDGIYTYRNPQFTTVRNTELLPDAVEIDLFNTVTLIATFISGVLFITCTAYLVWNGRRNA